jgi:hypothetical protein
MDHVILPTGYCEGIKTNEIREICGASMHMNIYLSVADMYSNTMGFGE